MANAFINRLKFLLYLFCGVGVSENDFLFVCLFVCFSRQGFSVALEPALELALVDQSGLKLTEICLPLPPECWD